MVEAPAALALRLEQLPYATAKASAVVGKIRQRAEDFQVDEVPAYRPAGHGEHLFVRFRKVGLDTRTAVRRLAEALGSDPRQASWAGQKDKVAVTTQWASLPGASPERALGLRLEGIEVLEAERHPHKLRTGHLRANRFAILLRECPPGAYGSVQQALLQLEEIGVPNYYGEQRFRGRSLERAWRWFVARARPPRDRVQRKWDVSVLQAALFNDWLACRLERESYRRSLAGDVMRKELTGGLFVSDDREQTDARVRTWEVSVTGPIYGAKMRRAAADAGRLEAEVLARYGLEPEAFAAIRKLAPGSRRAMRVRPAHWELEQAAQGLWLRFELPAGAYATSVLREVLESVRELPD